MSYLWFEAEIYSFTEGATTYRRPGTSGEAAALPPRTVCCEGDGVFLVRIVEGISAPDSSEWAPPGDWPELDLETAQLRHRAAFDNFNVYVAQLQNASNILIEQRERNADTDVMVARIADEGAGSTAETTATLAAAERVAAAVTRGALLVDGKFGDVTKLCKEVCELLDVAHDDREVPFIRGGPLTVGAVARVVHGPRKWRTQAETSRQVEGSLAGEPLITHDPGAANGDR